MSKNSLITQDNKYEYIYNYANFFKKNLCDLTVDKIREVVSKESIDIKEAELLNIRNNLTPLIFAAVDESINTDEFNQLIGDYYQDYSLSNDHKLLPQDFFKQEIFNPLFTNSVKADFLSKDNVDKYSNKGMVCCACSSLILFISSLTLLICSSFEKDEQQRNLVIAGICSTFCYCCSIFLSVSDNDQYHKNNFVDLVKDKEGLKETIRDMILEPGQKLSEFLQEIYMDQQTELPGPILDIIAEYSVVIDNSVLKKDSVIIDIDDSEEKKEDGLYTNPKSKVSSKKFSYSILNNTSSHSNQIH